MNKDVEEVIPTNVPIYRLDDALLSQATTDDGAKEVVEIHTRIMATLIAVLAKGMSARILHICPNRVNCTDYVFDVTIYEPEDSAGYKLSRCVSKIGTRNLKDVEIEIQGPRDIVLPDVARGGEFVLNVGDIVYVSVAGLDDSLFGVVVGLEIPSGVVKPFETTLENCIKAVGQLERLNSFVTISTISGSSRSEDLVTLKIGTNDISKINRIGEASKDVLEYRLQMLEQNGAGVYRRPPVKE